MNTGVSLTNFLPLATDHILMQHQVFSERKLGVALKCAVASASCQGIPITLPGLSTESLVNHTTVAVNQDNQQQYQLSYYQLNCLPCLICC